MIQGNSAWNDSYAPHQAKIPEYRVAEDKFASGYLAGLKRQKRLKPYLNQIYRGMDDQPRQQQTVVML